MQYPPHHQQQPYQPYPQPGGYPHPGAYPHQGGYPYPGPPAPAKVPAGVLVGVSLWRLLIIAFAFIGFGAAASEMGNPWPGLSQQASVLTGVCYIGLLLYPAFTGGRRHEPKSPWLSGALAVLLLLVCVTFLVVMEGDLDETWSLFEHLLTPLVVLIDFLAVGRNAAAAKWWHPITWVSFPLAYLVYFLASDVGLYGDFLDPDDDAFAGTVIGFLAAVLATGYLLYGAGKLRAAATRQRAIPQPGYHWNG